MKMKPRFKKYAFTLCALLTLLFFTPGGAAWAAFSGGSGVSYDPYIITTAAELDAVHDYLSDYFVLGNDIDLTAYLAPGGAGHSKWGASGWLPFGSSFNIFGFDGRGHVITGLWIDRSFTDNVGLFSSIGGTIKNLGIEIASAGIRANNHVGGLVGECSGSIENCYVTSNVSGKSRVGGMVGQLYGAITNSYATGNVFGSGRGSDSAVGGLAGYQSSGGSIRYSYATGNVYGYNYVGGLVGEQHGSIENCYVTGNVASSGGVNAGGLAGYQGDNTSIRNSFRYANLTVNGSIRPENNPNGIHGGTVTAAWLMTKATYTANDWLFSDSATTGPWYWDARGFPKLNMGKEKFPFRFLPGIIEVPSGGGEVDSEDGTVTLTAGGTVTIPGAGTRITLTAGTRINHATGSIFLPANETAAVETSNNTAIEISGGLTLDKEGRIVLLPDDANAVVTAHNGTIIKFSVGSTIKSEGAAAMGAAGISQVFAADEGYITTIVVGPDGGSITYDGNPIPQRLSGGATITISPEGALTVTNNVETVTLKVRFQGRPTQESAANIEKLTVKWIKGDAVIPQEETVTDQNGEAEITLP